MSSLESALRTILADLRSAQVGCALVGGLAVAVRTEPRFTQDIDLAVAVRDDAEAEELVRRFVAGGYEPATTTEQEATGRLAGVRLHTPDRSGVVDLLFASSGIEAEVVAAAEELEVLPGLSAPVAAVGHLIALKLLARDDETRPLDRADLQALRAVAKGDDRPVASVAIDLITERGFDRGRDLRAALDRLLPDER